MNKHVYLIRHGETDWEREGKTMGWTDIELNTTGIGQAVALKQRFTVPGYAGIYISGLIGLYSSDLKRCAKTAQILANAAAGIEVVLMQSLREKNVPSELDANFVTRVYLALSNIWELEDSQDRPIVIVSHDGVLRIIVAQILKLPYRADLTRLSGAFDLCNTSVTYARFSAGEWTLGYLNDTSHLRGNKHGASLLERTRLGVVG